MRVNGKKAHSAICSWLCLCMATQLSPQQTPTDVKPVSTGFFSPLGFCKHGAVLTTYND